MNNANVKELCLDIRRTIFKVAYNSGGAHLGGCFSCVELLCSLYFGGILNIDSIDINNENRDRFILSKGHAALSLYTVLQKRGFITEGQLFSFCKNNNYIGVHPKKNDIPGVEASTGSLGHGLSYGIGLALAAKYKKLNFRTYCMLGDGECQEGSVWEGALFAPQMKLDNLTVIIDYNKLQAMDELDNIVALNPLADKWKSFGWQVHEIDGHDVDEIIYTLKTPSFDKPKCIIAHTVKGKGVSFMENVPIWHMRMPNEHELEIVLKELDIKRDELDYR